MFSMIPWSKDLNLTEFYEGAAKRGYENNSNQKILVDCFRNEPRWQVWILHYDNQPVGSVACHSLAPLGPNAYRICARTCVFTDMIPRSHVRNLRYTIKEHQNPTAQFFIPTCIEWAGRDKDLYITSNESTVASQRQVHRIYCPALVETGALEKAAEITYRGQLQTAWKLNVDVFYKQLNDFGKWH